MSWLLVAISALVGYVMWRLYSSKSASAEINVTLDPTDLTLPRAQQIASGEVLTFEE